MRLFNSTTQKFIAAPYTAANIAGAYPVFIDAWNVGATPQPYLFFASTSPNGNGVYNKYPGSDQGVTSKYYLGITYADLGKLDDAEKAFLEVENKGNKTYAPLGRFALAQIYESRGKLADAERELRAIIDSPSILLSKEQATMALARLLAKTKPDDARKLLEPYRTSTRAAVSRAAIDNLSNLPQKK